MKRNQNDMKTLMTRNQNDMKTYKNNLMIIANNKYPTKIQY